MSVMADMLLAIARIDRMGQTRETEGLYQSHVVVHVLTGF